MTFFLAAFSLVQGEKEKKKKMPDVTGPISRWAEASVPIQTGTASNLVGITFNSVLPWHQI